MVEQDDKFIDNELEETVKNDKIILKKNFFQIAFATRYAFITVIAVAITTFVSVYIAIHPEVVWVVMNYPYAILFVLSVPVAIFLFSLLINFSTVIRRYLLNQVELFKESKRSAWFDFAIACFVAVSMAESGTFFGSTIKQLWFGYFVVLTIDVCTVQFMNARKQALMQNDEQKANSYMLGVWFTVIISAFGNVYSSLLNFDLPKDASRIPLWMGNAAPYIGVIFPALIVFLTYTVDAQIASKDIVERYNEQQDLQIRYLEAQENALSRKHDIQSRIAILRQKQSFLQDIFFTKNKIQIITETVQNYLNDRVSSQVDEKISTIAIPTAMYDDSALRERSKIIEANFIKLQEDYKNIQKQLEIKTQEYDDKITKIANVYNQIKIALPRIIETKVQEIHDSQNYELVAEQVFMRLIPEHITQQLQQIPEATVSIDRVEEIDQEVRTNMQSDQDQEKQQEIQEEQQQEEWNVARISAKSAKYIAKEKQCTIGAVRFAKFDLAATTFTSSKITEQALQAIYEQKLLPAKYFKIIEVTGWGGTKNDHIVIAVSPDTAQLQKLILEKIKILKKNQI